MKYVIESNCYLPFTENGTIIINGDRRIKARTWIRLGDRGKIAYVDSVSNDLNYSGDSIDRTTILSLSRIMVEKYVVGKLNKETIEVEDPPKTQEGRLGGSDGSWSCPGLWAGLLPPVEFPGVSFSGSGFFI